MQYVTYADGVVVSEGEAFLSSLELLEAEAGDRDKTDTDREVALRAQLLLFRTASTEDIKTWARREFYCGGPLADPALTMEDHIARGRHFRGLARQCAENQP